MLFKLVTVSIFLQALQNGAMGSAKGVGIGMDLAELNQALRGRNSETEPAAVCDCPNPLNGLVRFENIPNGLRTHKKAVINGTVSPNATRIIFVCQNDSGNKSLNFSLDFTERKAVASTFLNKLSVNEKVYDADDEFPVEPGNQFMLYLWANVDGFDIYLEGFTSTEYFYDFIRPSPDLVNLLIYGQLSINSIEWNG